MSKFVRLLFDDADAGGSGGAAVADPPVEPDDGNPPSTEPKTYDETYVKTLKDKYHSQVRAAKEAKEAATAASERLARLEKAVKGEDPDKDAEKEVDRYKSIAAEANQKLLKASVMTKAAELKWGNLSAIFPVMKENGYLADIDLDTLDGLQEAIDKFAAENEGLIKGTPEKPGKVGSGKNATPDNTETLDDYISRMTPEQKQAALMGSNASEVGNRYALEMAAYYMAQMDGKDFPLPKPKRG